MTALEFKLLGEKEPSWWRQGGGRVQWLKGPSQVENLFRGGRLIRSRRLCGFWPGATEAPSR